MPPSSEEELDDLAKALDGFERKVAPRKPEPWPAIRQRSRIEIGPKTQSTLRILAWLIRLSWAVWVVLYLISTPPRQIGDLVPIPFCGLVAWLIFQFHKAVLVASVRRGSGSR